MTSASDDAERGPAQPERASERRADEALSRALSDAKATPEQILAAQREQDRHTGDTGH